MKETVKVAAVQMNVKWLDPEANLASMEKTMHILAIGKTELIVFPELANSGYVVGPDSNDYAVFSQKYLKIADTIPGRYTEALGALTKKYGVYVVVGLLEAHPTIPATLYNSAVLIGPSGGLIGSYHKGHIPGPEKHYFYGGGGIDVFPTDLGNISMLICADNAYPEAGRVATLKGAEIVCVPYARRKGLAFDDLEMYARITSVRAFENLNFFIACNRVGTEGDVVFEGRSNICGPKGNFLAKSDSESEEVLTATLRSDDLLTARLRFPRFRDRRPELYDTVCRPL